MTPAAPDSSFPLHQAAFDLVAEGVLWVDKVGKIRHANAAAATLLGYSRHQLAQSSYLEINPNFSLLGWKKHWKQLDPERGEFLDTQFVNAEGRLFGVRGKISFDQAAGDESLCLIVFSTTEAGRREADLLDAVESHGRIAGWEYNLSTGQVYLGPLLREWFGYQSWSVY
jgi:PAS domain S-box-containing protein